MAGVLHHQPCASRAAPGGRLRVDLAAICANHVTVARGAGAAEVGAVVKADAYGLGAQPVALALARQGCRSFFVATLDEALSLRPALPPDCAIHVLNGLAEGEAAACVDANLVPVLNSPRQARDWCALGDQLRRPLAAAVQLDTGMSRLGLSDAELDDLLRDDLEARASIRLLMTHLACAEEPQHPANAAQLQRLRAAAARFEIRPALSIANSAGAALGGDFTADLVRPGIALFGVATTKSLAGRLRPVVTLEVRVLQVRSTRRGTGVGYGLAHVTDRDGELATLGIGYADGWPRRLGEGRSAAWFEGVRLPVVGRVSMDSLTVDASGLPPGRLQEGDYVELLGPDARLEEVAAAADAIPYEILTGFGARLQRVHAPASPGVAT